MNKSVYLQTYGCQMNERDSEEVLGMLTAQGYEIARQPEAADVILLNTCSVRQHAEERAFGKMGELSELKRERPDLVLGIIGCMAKLQQEAIFKRLPAVDSLLTDVDPVDGTDGRQQLFCSLFVVHCSLTNRPNPPYLRTMNYELRTASVLEFPPTNTADHTVPPALPPSPQLAIA